jgi:hypothetical protein
MAKKRDLVRKSLSVGLATLLLTLSVAVPVMDRGGPVGGSAVESEHQPGRCGHAHDHRVCAQVGANLSVAAAVYNYRPAHVAVRMANPGESRSPILDASFEGPRSRAPPLA